MASEVEVRPGVQNGDLVVGVWPEGKPGRMSVIPREWKAALLDALLRDRGYEAQQVDMTLAPTKDGGLTPCGWTSESDETPYTIYVPVQGEGDGAD